MPKFSTEVQDRVWDHLNSSSGDVTLRQEALRLLVETSFFSKFGWGRAEANETDAFGTLKRHLDRDAFDKFCKDGKQRLLDAAQPPATVEYAEVLVQVLVPIKTGDSLSPRVNFKKGTFADDQSIAKWVAANVTAEVGSVGSTHFQLDPNAKITVKGIAVLEREKK